MSWFQTRGLNQLGASPQQWRLTPCWEAWEAPQVFVSQVPLHAPSLSIPDLCLRRVEATRLLLLWRAPGVLRWVVVWLKGT